MIAADTQVKSPVNKSGASIRRSWWSAALPIICWQLAALLFAEGVLFCAGIGEEEIYKFDKHLGFRHFPDKLVTWRSEGYARSYFDSDGMREPGLTIQKPANTLRVALMGDSAVESLQVPIENTYGQLIEKNLGPINGNKVQVLNFGNSGYSTTQECLSLEEKVFKYQPDLVLLGYSNRDMMENWSPPDETISNVRPAALKLPGRPLIIDNSPVLNWLKTPRARFLQSIEWIRHHSRVWGTIAVTELQLSMREPLVKSILTFSTNPVRCARTWLRSINSFVASVTGRHAPAAPLPVARAPVAGPVATQALAQPATQMTAQPTTQPATTSPVPAPSAKIKTAPDPGEKNQYTKLLSATMGGLIARMNQDCLAHHSKFMIVGMPCHFDLVPAANLPVVADLTYVDELKIVSGLCAKTSVPFLDVNEPARALPLKEKESFFYVAHFAPAGHAYMSQSLIPAVRAALSASH
jgi:hypothetical protein